MNRHERPNKGDTDVWLTPLNIIHALGEFDLDPCGEIYHKTAKTIYTENGLKQKWFGRVWLNPPYSNVFRWLLKMLFHNHGIALVFARMDTEWCQQILPHCSSIFFPKGRIKFLTPELKTKGTAGAASMFLSFGEIPDWNKLGAGLIWNQ
jgi:hypothetical protein